MLQIGLLPVILYFVFVVNVNLVLYLLRVSLYGLILVWIYVAYFVV